MIIKNFILLNLELEIEDKSLPEIGDLAKIEINVQNDIKRVVLASPVKIYGLKQTDVSHNLSVVRFSSNFSPEEVKG